jgi:hypothetical protein
VNPAPRRALRKADDADVHPATTRPAPLSPVAGVGELTPTASPVVPDASPQQNATTDAASTEKSKSGKASAGKARALESAADKKPGSAKPAAPNKASGDAPVTAAKKASGATKSTVAVWDNRFHGNTSDVLRAQQTTHDLLRGAEGILEVKVPKRLRRAVRLEAENRGLTVDKVVIRLLADWIESP